MMIITSIRNQLCTISLKELTCNRWCTWQWSKLHAKMAPHVVIDEKVIVEDRQATQSDGSWVSLISRVPIPITITLRPREPSISEKMIIIIQKNIIITQSQFRSYFLALCTVDVIIIHVIFIVGQGWIDFFVWTQFACILLACPNWLISITQ